MKPVFFPSPAAWRAWLEERHAEIEELWVEFYNKGSGKPSITWPKSVDGALCFGWIGGVRKSLDEISYVIRFTSRRSRSIWSTVNIKRVGEIYETRTDAPRVVKFHQLTCTVGLPVASSSIRERGSGARLAKAF